jgi:hypothetical protein
MSQSITYRLYMHSSLWQLRRWLWWRTSRKRCEDCNRPLVLHRTGLVSGSAVLTVHHLSYRRLLRERRSDVALLCWPCHCRREPWKGRRP